MVITVVIPSFDTRTAVNWAVAEANLYFPEGSDIGTEIADIPIVLVYNNDHHYVGTRSLKRNCKKLIAKVSETCMGFHYKIDKMIQTALEIERSN